MTCTWTKLDIGGKMIAVSAVLAIGSIFMPWIDMVTRHSSGWEQFAFVLLLLYVYPVITVAKNQPMSRIFGISSSLAASAAAVAYMEWKTVPFEGENLCFAGEGTYLFLVASLLLFAGILKYQPVHIEAGKTVETDETVTP